ncbi:MAG TPA: hypothetical protein VK990_08480 [Acidimicrobiia bacterium]|nr:hypothetical protein [Acidimicrobiia bacterium]
MRSRPLVVMMMTLALAACTQTSGTARGVVTSVSGTLAEVDSFVVLVDGAELEFAPVTDGEYDFPLSHLREHQRTGEPVLVGWEIVGSVRYALTLADG